MEDKQPGFVLRQVEVFQCSWSSPLVCFSYLVFFFFICQRLLHLLHSCIVCNCLVSSMIRMPVWHFHSAIQVELLAPVILEYNSTYRLKWVLCFQDLGVTGLARGDECCCWWWWWCGWSDRNDCVLKVFVNVGCKQFCKICLDVCACQAADFSSQVI